MKNSQTVLCYYDKKHIFHACNNFDNDCEGCCNEHVIARGWECLCHWCGNSIVSDRIRGFCNKDCQRQWMAARMSWDHSLEDSMYWSDFGQIAPIFTLEDLRLAQITMLGKIFV